MINFILSILLFFALGNINQQKIIAIFVFFAIIFLFDGGFFLNFNIDKKNVSNFNTKKFINSYDFSFITLIKFIDPYF